MKVAVGSTNPVKIEAVKLAFETVFSETQWEVEGIEVTSGVSAQPMTDDESIKGARSRAQKAMQKLSADFGIGLESGLQEIDTRWFNCGWIVIITQNGQESIGATIKMPTPEKLMQLIRQGKELGEVIDLLSHTKNSKHQGGHFGFMTNNVVTRTIGYRDGIIAALSRFLHPELFEE